MVAANVHLFAASENLACWFHDCDRVGPEKSLRLRPNQRARFAQTVGYASRPCLEGP